MNKYIIYYAILLTVLAGKVVTTIYQGSMIVNHGSKIAQLQNRKQALKNERLELTNELAQYNSLNNVMASANISDYTVIANPLSVDTTTAVAISQ